MFKNYFCPNCMSDTSCEVVEITDSINVKEEVIKVKSKVVVCQSCFTQFNNTEVPSSALDEAYETYRSMHNLLTPMQIKYYRLSFNYSLNDLAKKSGVNPERIELIERGSLHDKQADIGFRKAFGL